MHGGNIYSNKIKYDFSVNVNPLGIPKSAKKIAYKAIKNSFQYPDLESSELKNLLAKKFNVNKNQICLGNGASEILNVFIKSANLKNALLVAPCFTSYAKILKNSQINFEYLNLSEENNFIFDENFTQKILLKLKSKNFDLLILTNPNNPNGKFTSINFIKKIAAECENQNTFFLLDECFIELTFPKAQSFVSQINNFNKVLILRAFTKSFAIPGLRLGFSISSEKISSELEKNLPEWNISLVAQKVGKACLMQSSKYFFKTQKIICHEKKYLISKLKNLPLRIFPSDANFILFKIELEEKSSLKNPDFKNSFFGKLSKKSALKNQNQKNLFEYLKDKKILIRLCDDYESLSNNFFRIAIKNHHQNKILVKNLEDFFNAKN